MENKNNTMLAKPMDAKWKAIVNEAWDDVSDWLSDTYEFCHAGFDVKE